MPLVLRRIEERDRNKNFETGNSHFDYDSQGNKIGLGFYIDRDISQRFESYVLEENNNIIGLLSIQKRADHLYISRIGIQKNMKGKGFGSILLEDAVKLAAEYGYDRILAEADSEGMPFLENLGFAKINEYENDHWGKSATMELRLYKD